MDKRANWTESEYSRVYDDWQKHGQELSVTEYFDQEWEKYNEHNKNNQTILQE